MRYDAFISYRHAQLDTEMAKMLHKGLETFKIPRAVQKTSGKKKINRVFRDQEELPIGSDLTDNIGTAIRESEYLIVVCSPRTPGSEWVHKEIQTFIAIHGRDHVLAFLVEGEPSESFPEELLIDENGNPVEPLAADVRGENMRERKKLFKTELMRLAAPLLGCAYDDLKQRHKERRMKKIATIGISTASLVAVAGIAFGVYNARQNAIITENYQAKLENQSKYYASTALDLYDNGDRETAALIAARALPDEENGRPYVPQAEYALNKSLHVYDCGVDLSTDRMFEHDQNVNQISESQDGVYMVSVDAGQSVYIWEIESATLLGKVQGEYDESGYPVYVEAVYMLDDCAVVVRSDDTNCYNLDGSVKWTVSGCGANSCWDKAGKLALSHDKTLVIVDCATGKTIDKWELEGEYNATYGMIFSEDGRYLSVPYYTNRMLEKEVGKPGQVAIIDTKNKEVVNCTTLLNTHAASCFVEGKGLAYVSKDSVSLLSDSTGPGKAVVEFFDLQGNLKWQDIVEYNTRSDYNSYTYLKYRSIDEVDEIVLAMDGVIYEYDALSGKVISSANAGGTISEFKAASDSEYVFYVTTTGDLKGANMATGAVVDKPVYQANCAINNFDMYKGVIVYSPSNTPYVLSARYIQGSTVEKISDVSGSIFDIDVSNDGELYFIQHGQIGEERTYALFDNDNNQLDSFTTNEGTSAWCGFVSDTKYAAFNNYGKNYLYDVAEKKVTEIDKEYTDLVGFSINHRYVALKNDDESIKVINLEDGTSKTTIVGNAFKIEGTLSSDGKTLYVKTDTGIDKYDVTSGIKESYDFDFQMYAIYKRTPFSLNHDNSKMVIGCTDGYVRVVNTDTFDVTDEIQLSLGSDGFAMFSEDDTKLIMQGDDYYVRVYDANEHTLLSVSDEQFNIIEDAYYEEGSNKVILNSGDNLLILTRDTYNIMSYVEIGYAYNAKTGKIYLGNRGELYTCDYMDYNQLLAEKDVQFAGKELSDTKILQYHIQ